MSGPGGANVASHGPSIRAQVLVGAAVAAAVVLLVAYAGGAGPRGTDQYWYVADVETLAATGSATTNTVFPVGLLGPDASLPPPVIHNILSIYLAAMPAEVLGPMGGWLFLNLVATLGAATLIYGAARGIAGAGPALLSAAIFPLLPMSLWFTAQPMAEASTAFFVALVVLLASAADTSARRWLALAAAAGLLYLSRESYLPLLLLVPAAYFWTVRGTASDQGGSAARPAHTFVAVLPIMVVVVVALGIEGTVLGRENVEFSYSRLLHTAVPGQTDNMWFNFDLSPANLSDANAFEPGLVLQKFAGHLAAQFVAFDSVATAVFFWAFNLLALVGLAVAWRSRHDRGRQILVLFCLAPVGVHLLTIGLFQNQVRYTFPAIPGLLVLLAIGLRDLGVTRAAIRRWPLAVALVAALVVGAPTGVLARIARTDAERHAIVERRAEAVLMEHLTPAERLLIAYEEAPQVLGYAARPRMVLYVSPDYSANELTLLRDRFAADWLLAPLDSPIVLRFGLGPARPVGTVETARSTWGLFNIRR